MEIAHLELADEVSLVQVITLAKWLNENEFATTYHNLRSTLRAAMGCRSESEVAYQLMPSASIMRNRATVKGPRASASSTVTTSDMLREFLEVGMDSWAGVAVDVDVDVEVLSRGATGICCASTCSREMSSGDGMGNRISESLLVLGGRAAISARGLQLTEVSSCGCPRDAVGSRERESSLCELRERSIYTCVLSSGLVDGSGIPRLMLGYFLNTHLTPL